MRACFSVAFGLLVSSFSPLAIAVTPIAPLTLEPAVKDPMILLTDGKGHYVAVTPFVTAEHTLFYGDGKKFSAVPVVSSSSNGNEKFDMHFADPRFYIEFRQASVLDFKDGKYNVECGDHTVALQRVDAKTAKPMLDAAVFLPSPRKWRPHVLLRDSRGIYYYVDRGRTKQSEGQYRLFVGPKGNLVQQKMTNIVSDSQGDIFSTKTGDLRLVIDAGPERNAQKGAWIKNEKSQQLTIVPVDANSAMIHTDLGVYAGEHMGTPCDDL